VITFTRRDIQESDWVNALYPRGRAFGRVELGSVMFGRVDAATGKETPAPRELVRLAFPRRVYTQSHFEYVIEVLDEIWKYRKQIPAHQIVRQAPFLRHFTAHFTHSRQKASPAPGVSGRTSSRTSALPTRAFF